MAVRLAAVSSKSAKLGSKPRSPALNFWPSNTSEPFLSNWLPNVLAPFTVIPMAREVSHELVQTQGFHVQLVQLDVDGVGVFVTDLDSDGIFRAVKYFHAVEVGHFRYAANFFQTGTNFFLMESRSLVELVPFFACTVSSRIRCMFSVTSSSAPSVVCARRYRR